jgi:hypothetical protein
LALPANHRPAVIADVAAQIVPSCLVLFDGLQKAIQTQAEQRNADSDDEDGDEQVEERDDGLASDEDEIDEATLEYLETMNKVERDSGNDGSCSGDDDSDDEFVDETDLEAYETPLDGENADVDEFLFFRDTLAGTVFLSESGRVNNCNFFQLCKSTNRRSIMCLLVI